MWRKGEIVAIAPMAANNSGARSRPGPRRTTAREPMLLRVTPPPDSSSASGKESDRIMKDYTNRVTVARVHLADAVIQLHLIIPPHSFHRPTVDREDGRVPFLKL